MFSSVLRRVGSRVQGAHGELRDQGKRAAGS